MRSSDLGRELNPFPTPFKKKIIDLFEQAALMQAFGNSTEEQLGKPLDLLVEYLDEASIIYDGVAVVRIPELAPFCTRTMTSMEYNDGIKITDMKGTKKQRQELAGLDFVCFMEIPMPGIRNAADKLNDLISDR